MPGYIMVPFFYTLNTGFTPEEGETRELTYLCGGTVEDFEITDVSDKIAVKDMGCVTMPVLSLGRYDGQKIKDRLAEGTLSATLVQTMSMSPGEMHKKRTCEKTHRSHIIRGIAGEESMPETIRFQHDSRVGS